MTDISPILELRSVAKTFTLHLQAAEKLAVVRDVTLAIAPGECVVIVGPSGTGKSSVLRMIYGNYRCEAGQIVLRSAGGDIDIAWFEPAGDGRWRLHARDHVANAWRTACVVDTLAAAIAIVCADVERLYWP